MPDEVMVALTEHRISLLLDHHAGQLVWSGQTAATIVITMVLSVSVDLKLASVATARVTHVRNVAALTGSVPDPARLSRALPLPKRHAAGPEHASGTPDKHSRHRRARLPSPPRWRCRERRAQT